MTVNTKLNAIPVEKEDQNEKTKMSNEVTSENECIRENVEDPECKRNEESDIVPPLEKEKLLTKTNKKSSDEDPTRLDGEKNPKQNEPLSLIVSLEDGSFKCTTCGKLYKQKASLLKHVSANHGLTDTVSLTCKVCGKIFENLRKMTRHGKESKCKELSN